jgi:hypothetical protein
LAVRLSTPIVFLDVDGKLIPFRSRPAESALAANHSLVSAGDASGNPLLDRLDPGDGRKLLALGCRLAWATTWMADANDLVAPRLGLPELPVVDSPDDDRTEHRLHWKTPFLTRWAAGRTFVWLAIALHDRVNSHAADGASPQSLGRFRSSFRAVWRAEHG